MIMTRLNEGASFRDVKYPAWCIDRAFSSFVELFVVQVIFPFPSVIKLWEQLSAVSSADLLYFRIQTSFLGFFFYFSKREFCSFSASGLTLAGKHRALYSTNQPCHAWQWSELYCTLHVFFFLSNRSVGIIYTRAAAAWGLDKKLVRRWQNHRSFIHYELCMLARVASRFDTALFRTQIWFSLLKNNTQCTNESALVRRRCFRICQG